MFPLSEAFIADVLREFPKFRIVPKAGRPLQRLIDLSLKLITLGGQRQYLTRYHTVLGDTLYVPTLWDQEDDLDRLILLRHERIHLRQRRRYGTFGMSFLYVFPFLPIGLAYGRARIEWEAYAETLRAIAELRGLAVAESIRLEDHLVAQFTSAAYGWMWPFPATIRRWVKQTLTEIRQEMTAEK